MLGGRDDGMGHDALADRQGGPVRDRLHATRLAMLTAAKTPENSMVPAATDAGNQLRLNQLFGVISCFRVGQHRGQVSLP